MTVVGTSLANTRVAGTTAEPDVNVGAGVTDKRKVLTLTTLGAAAGVTVFFATLLGAYFQFRSTTQVWPPKYVHLNTYIGVMCTVTMLMASVSMGWALSANRRAPSTPALRGQVVASLGLTIGFAIAFLNGLWFLIANLGFGLGPSPYSVIFYALVFSAGANTLAGLVMVVQAFFRAIGGQLSGVYHDRLRATALYWHFSVATWTVVYATVYLFK